MRVLHLLKTSVGGMWAFRQMRELVRLGVEVYAALPGDGPLVAASRDAGIIVHPLQTDFSVRQPLVTLDRMKALRELVASVQPDILHSHFVGTTLVARLALGRRHPLPRLFQVPGPLHLEHSLFRRADLSTAGPSDHWIGSCRWTCDRYLSSGVPGDRVILSYYGTDIERMGRGGGGQLRSELGWSRDTIIVGMVAFMYAPKIFLGQLRGLKGHEDFIDAIGICRRDNPAIRGVVIGGAWNHAMRYEDRVKRYARKRCGGGIAFLGTRQDVSALYDDFDVAVHPSHSENVGGAVESLLKGVPTIATDVGGFPDVVKPGETGWLVPPRSPVELSRAIMEAIADREKAARYAVAGHSLTSSLFDVRRTAGEIRAIYEAIA